jgi:2-(1,2-epoxy-1,2-dihydrophenyl)acetyl-CoA isomerase
MLAFSKIGLIPDSSLNWLLPRLIGYTRAYQLAITAEKLPAQTALAWGMVNAVAPADQFEAAVGEWAARLAQGATKAYALTKRAMWRSFEQDLDVALDYEAHLQTVAAHTEDNREGVAAFLEKRAAVFKGR